MYCASDKRLKIKPKTSLIKGISLLRLVYVYSKYNTKTKLKINGNMFDLIREELGINDDTLIKSLESVNTVIESQIKIRFLFDAFDVMYLSDMEPGYLDKEILVVLSVPKDFGSLLNMLEFQYDIQNYKKAILYEDGCLKRLAPKGVLSTATKLQAPHRKVLDILFEANKRITGRQLGENSGSESKHLSNEARKRVSKINEFFRDSLEIENVRHKNLIIQDRGCGYYFNIYEYRIEKK